MQQQQFTSEQKAAYLRLLGFYDDLFSSDAGQTILADLSRQFDVQNQKESEPIDPIGYGIRQGERRAYWFIWNRWQSAKDYRAQTFVQPTMTSPVSLAPINPVASIG